MHTSDPVEPILTLSYPCSALSVQPQDNFPISKPNPTSMQLARNTVRVLRTFNKYQPTPINRCSRASPSRGCGGLAHRPLLNGIRPFRQYATLHSSGEVQDESSPTTIYALSTPPGRSAIAVVRL